MLPRPVLGLCNIVVVAGLSFQAVAEQDHHPRNNYDCPDDYSAQTCVMSNGTVVEDPNLTIDEESGAGSEAITHCLSIANTPRY